MNKTVVVGMSGGVDSSVAALLLKQQGYNVIGLFMHNWEENDEDGACTAADDFEDVKRVCEKLQIPYYSVNFAQQYLDKVFADFLEEYKKGRTPNPDVLCNREIKFGPFLEYALMLGADYVATGHYANIRHEDGVHYLQRAIDENKDQTYFLNQLSQQQLEKVIFPVGNIEKPELRRIAEENGLITAQKKDSTGVCFIGERKFRQFLQNYLPAKSGNIVDTQGRVVGKHEGVMFYTYGQRRGLHIGGMSGSNGGRWFVYDKDVKNNILYVSQGDESVLYSSGLVSYKVNWIPHTPQTKTFECLARFRHRQPLQKVTVTLHEDKVEVKFAQKQRAITPGQYVVFYNERDCLGGGIIEEVIK